MNIIEMKLLPTYAATKKQQFNWHVFLSKDMKDLTYDQCVIAYQRSRSWVTCALGNQCAVIPRHEHNNAPKDELLFMLGCDFPKHIAGMSDAKFDNKQTMFNIRRDQAREVLCQIEERSLFLINEIVYHDEFELA